MYTYRSGSLGASAPKALTSFCATYPDAAQCVNPPTPPSALTTGVKTHWGLILGALVAAVVVYKVAS